MAGLGITYVRDQVPASREDTDLLENATGLQMARPAFDRLTDALGLGDVQPRANDAPLISYSGKLSDSLATQADANSPEDAGIEGSERYPFVQSACASVQKWQPGDGSIARSTAQEANAGPSDFAPCLKPETRSAAIGRCSEIPGNIHEGDAAQIGFSLIGQSGQDDAIMVGHLATQVDLRSPTISFGTADRTPCARSRRSFHQRPISDPAKPAPRGWRRTVEIQMASSVSQRRATKPWMRSITSSSGSRACATGRMT